MLSSVTSVAPQGDYLLELQLANGSSMRVNLGRKILTARFAVLKDPEVWSSAVTDGHSIHWQDLLSITLTEVLEILGNN